MTTRTVLALVALAAAAPLAAQEFPARAVRVIVPQPPGGGFDTVARIVAEPFAKFLGQPVIVENRPGAGTIVGTEAAAKSDPDGYTLLLGASANLALNPGLFKKLPYDPKNDFALVGLAAGISYTLVARNDLPLGSLKEILEHARRNPGKLTYASGGNGTGQHIAAAVMFHLAKVSVLHVPYKGAQAAYQDLIPGRVDLFFDASSTAKGHIDNGRVKPIAVSFGERLAIHPEVPTVREAGVPEFEMETWVGYFARAGAPAPVLERLRADFERTVALPEITAALEKRGLRPIRLPVREAEALVAKDIDRWTSLIRSAGLSAD
ncbi:MAG TPA: tripartite tricarboxylate transporter substrate binding protein [Burkholderiales bacterium]|nr:tripartite tricarboxylate transporter substrate binding protein [Burkholderiales bacterium]